jgi:hypothetical protein
MNVPLPKFTYLFTSEFYTRFGNLRTGLEDLEKIRYNIVIIPQNPTNPPKTGYAGLDHPKTGHYRVNR